MSFFLQTGIFPPSLTRGHIKHWGRFIRNSVTNLCICTVLPVIVFFFCKIVKKSVFVHRVWFVQLLKSMLFVWHECSSEWSESQCNSASLDLPWNKPRNQPATVTTSLCCCSLSENSPLNYEKRHVHKTKTKSTTSGEKRNNINPLLSWSCSVVRTSLAG